MNTKKKLLSFILALSIVFAVLPQMVFAADGTLDGDGTADSPYLIADAADLKAFRDTVNAEASSTKCAKLTNDINLNNEEWIPIFPTSEYITEAYAGTFDGDNHTISGLSINSSKANQGLFGAINGATVKNLKVDGNVTSSNNYIGGIIGKIQKGSVINCSFSGTVITTKSKGYAGGIIGGTNGSTAANATILENCANSGSITGETKGTVGGIIGYAQFASIKNCYNTGTITGATRSGGIAGQLQKNASASNCYNIGTATADICDFLYESSSLSNCFYKAKATNAGTGTVTSCEQITDAAALLEKLGDAFIADDENINNGYPILKWQKAAEVVPKNPHISITGGAVMYIENNSTIPQTTLSVSFTDMDAASVVWSADSDIITLEAPEYVDENNSKTIIKAVKPGKATVTATVGEYTAAQEITVYPFITTVEIEGDVVVGNTVKAKVNVLGGEEYDYDTYPELTFQWKYLTADDYLSDNTGTSSYQNITGAASREFTIPEDLKGDYLSFEFYCNGEYKTPSRPVKILSVQEAEEIKKAEEEAKIKAEKLDKLSAVKATLGDYYKITPVFGEDNNIVDILKADLTAKSVDLSEFNIALTQVETVYGGAEISENGDITYFYADPNTTPSIKNGSFKTLFTLSIDDAEITLDVPVIVYWDQNKVRETMKSEILDKVTADSILGENTAADHITDNLVLPKVVDDKKWTLVSWQSSDESVISVSSENQTTADTLFNPYVGKIKRGAEDKTVTLTAIFNFQLTNDITGSEQPITMSKTFDVTVKAVGTEEIEAIKQDLNDKLDAGFEKAGLSDAVSGEKLTEKDGKYTALNDILFPTTRDFSVDGKYYPVTITTNSEAIEASDVNNAARTAVYRPAVGKPDADAKVTVTITDKNSNVSASRAFNITVPALTSEEVNAEKALMQKVKDAYFDGIKGENTDKDNISANLAPFFEVYEDNGSLVWVRDNASKSNHGIIAEPIEGWEELEAWRLFKSSNPAVVSYENLLVTVPKKAKSVNISSVLSSETLGRYGELYKSDPVKFADYADMADLYRQSVSADIVVRGKSTPSNMRPMAVEETVDVTFTLKDSSGALIKKTSYKNLDEGVSVFDVFKKALTENGYKFDKKGSYITSVTTPDGRTIKELSEGANSGWLYRVNGKIPEVNMGSCGLSDGDDIIVFFTKDYSKEPEFEKYKTGGASGGGSKAAATPKPTASPKAAAANYGKFAEAAAHYLSGSTASDDLFGSEWTVIALADSGIKSDNLYDKYYNSLIKYLKDNNGVLSSNKYTEYSRVILALNAIGKSPENVEGYNLLAPLADYDTTIAQGINGAAWALIALDSGNYSIPENTGAKTQATRDKYISRILACQLPSGGFALSADAADADIDITAMALRALAPYQDNSFVKTATDKAVAFLSKSQTANGGFLSYGEGCSESAAQVIIALSALGISPSDSRFVKNGKTILDNLMTFYVNGGGFKHVIGDKSANVMSTEQALMCLNTVCGTEISGKKAAETAFGSLLKLMPVFYLIYNR